MLSLAAPRLSSVTESAESPLTRRSIWTIGQPEAAAAWRCCEPDVSAGRNDQTVDLFLKQQLHGLDLAVEQLVAVRKEHAEALRAGNVSDAAQDARVERALYIARNDADRLGLARNKASGEKVGTVA